MKEALSCANVPNFKASKGWCDKFMKRNKETFEKMKSCYNKYPERSK